MNRRVVESLIKGGSFDSLKDAGGAPGGLDQAMEAGQQRQRDREEGQASLFDVLGGRPRRPAARRRAAPVVPDWPQGERLAYEKECSASSSPATRWSATATSLDG